MIWVHFVMVFTHIVNKCLWAGLQEGWGSPALTIKAPCYACLGWLLCRGDKCKRSTPSCGGGLDVVGAFACFIQEYACPNAQWMGRILFQVSGNNAGVCFLDQFFDQGGHPAGRRVHQGSFHGAIAFNGHAIRLFQSSGSEDRPRRASDWAWIWANFVCASVIVWPFFVGSSGYAR